MKIWICLLVAVAACSAADTKSDKKPAAVTQKPAVKAPAPLSIPAGAVEIEPGTFSQTDAQGRKWLYRKTPFGVARFEDKPAGSTLAAQTAEPAPITAVEDGDIVRFERPGPFGPYRWQKHKSDLDKTEEAALERTRGKAGSSEAKQE